MCVFLCVILYCILMIVLHLCVINDDDDNQRTANHTSSGALSFIDWSGAKLLDR